jgi:competence ComEA-like helix-hairpin-helix protein
MFFFTPHERRAVIFIAAVFFCGTCLSILFKLKPPLYQHLNVLDEPPSRPKVDINQATYEELLTVPGLGPSTAARIIYARQEKGHFDSLDELRQVKRFSQKMLDRARPHLTAGGK